MRYLSILVGRCRHVHNGWNGRLEDLRAILRACDVGRSPLPDRI